MKQKSYKKSGKNKANKPAKTFWEHRKEALRKKTASQMTLKDIGINIIAWINILTLPIVAIVLRVLLSKESWILWMGIIFIIHATIQLTGYLLKLRFVFCSLQIMHNTRMTPNYINWNVLDKGDIYGIPAIEFVVGIIGIAGYIFL